MDRATKIAEQKKAFYNKHKEEINQKRRETYRISKNNGAVGDVFTTDGIKSMKIKNSVVNTDKMQWQEGMKVPSYLDAVQNKSKTDQRLCNLYENSYEVDQQTSGVNFNKKCLRPPPTTHVRNPTPRDVIDKNDIPAWKKGGKESTFASNPDFISHYASGFF